MWTLLFDVSIWLVCGWICAMAMSLIKDGLSPSNQEFGFVLFGPFAILLVVGAICGEKHIANFIDSVMSLKLSWVQVSVNYVKSFFR